MNILGRDYEKECRVNPYDKKHINEISNKTSPSPLFRIKKGYCQHMIDKNGIYSKNHISNFVRDGNRYIQKVDRAEMPHSIDPAQRCERHDRHMIMPGFRDIKNKNMLDPLE